MRTLVISDLHLGARGGRDLLRHDQPRAALLESLAGADRLVLLGDVIEMRQGPLAAAMAAAAGVLEQVGAALGRPSSPPTPSEAAEVVLVPGNHDHHLLAAWRERQARSDAGRRLGTGVDIGWEDGDLLGEVAARMAPARLRVAYPGVWLREDVYAMHGHYIDRHTTVPMLERLGAGLMARLIAEPPAAPVSAEDYEAVLEPLYAWIHAIAQTGGRGAAPAAGGRGASHRARQFLIGSGRRARSRRATLGLGFRAAVGALNRAGVGELRADLSGEELRRAALRAAGEVARRLELEPAAHVVFGHTHRAGPLPGDDPAEWRTPGGARLLNSGSWVYEPAYGAGDPNSPYRPGWAVAIEDGLPPRLINLLDGRRPRRPA